MRNVNSEWRRRHRHLNSSMSVPKMKADIIISGSDMPRSNEVARTLTKLSRYMGCEMRRWQRQ